MYLKQYNTGTETDTESMGQDRKARNEPILTWLINL